MLTIDTAEIIDVPVVPFIHNLHPTFKNPVVVNVILVAFVPAPDVTIDELAFAPKTNPSYNHARPINCVLPP